MIQRIFILAFLLALTLPSYTQDTSNRHKKDLYLYRDHSKYGPNPIVKSVQVTEATPHTLVVVDSGSIEVNPSGFFLPPPLLPHEPAKTLVQWFANQSKLCDTITSKTICVFRLFKTPDKNYAIYLVFAQHSKNEDHTFEYISSVGNSFQLPETKSMTFDQILEKVSAEYQTFSRSDRQAAERFEKAESVNTTVDNYNIVKLHGR